MTHNQLLFVIYDGIHNSVFQSQVLQPILKRLEESQNLEITLVSFEKTKLSAHVVEKIIQPHARLRVEILKRAPFVIRPLLYYCTHQFEKRIKDTLYSTITARGPIAGWIAMKALKKTGLEKLTVQARGLCAQEYRFAYEHCTPTLLKRLLYNFFYNTYENIERDVYSTTKIEAVSSALKQYLVEHFGANPIGADPKKITLATKDIPKKIDPQKIQAWKKEVRQELGISDNAFVYVYAGSARPWQCVEETLDWFAEQGTRSDPSIRSTTLKLRRTLRMSENYNKINPLVFKQNPSPIIQNLSPLVFKKNLSPLILSDFFLKIVSKDQSKHPFLLILTQDKDVFKKLIKEKNIPATSYLIKSVRPNDLYKYLAAANAGLMFRKKDIVNWVARPTKMLEYQSVGLKVVHNGNVGCLSTTSSKNL
jgi:hypothetical protein